MKAEGRWGTVERGRDRGEWGEIFRTSTGPRAAAAAAAADLVSRKTTRTLWVHVFHSAQEVSFVLLQQHQLGPGLGHRLELMLLTASGLIA